MSGQLASSAWDPHTHRNIQKIEQVQLSASRFVIGDCHRTSSVTDMMSALNWSSLQNCRLHSRLVMMYKIHHDLVDIKAEDYLIGHKALKHYELRGQNPGTTDIYWRFSILRFILPENHQGLEQLSWRPSYLHIPRCLQDCIEGSPTEVISSQLSSFYLHLVYNAPCSSTCRPWDDACAHSIVTYLLLLEASTIQGERKKMT